MPEQEVLYFEQVEDDVCTYEDEAADICVLAYDSEKIISCPNCFMESRLLDLKDKAIFWCDGCGLDFEKVELIPMVD